MTNNVLKVISSLAEAASVETQGPGRRPRRPVITISRDWGAGGDIIAGKLGQRFELPVYDETVLAEVAARLEDDPAIVRLLDEGFGRAKDMWLYRLFSGKDIGPDTYRDTLVKVIMSLGRVGGIILGRGAHVILAESCALRVRVIGSADVCARRMAAAGHGSERDLLAHCADVNHRRGKFVWDVFHSRLSDASQFDLIINTDRMSDFDDVVDMLMSMAEAIHAGRVLGESFGRV